MSNLGKDSPFALAEARGRWDRARRRFWLRKLLRPFRRHGDDLVSFEQVQKSLRLVQGVSRGVQEIPLDRIKGSVGRYKDFTLAFLPRKAKMRDRWQQIDAFSATEGMPPIAVYRVGGVYFVLDGNHRVSVAKQLGMKTIEAHVMEFKGPVPLSPEADLDEIFLKGEQADFLATTHIDRLRPGHGIEFTAPGRYRQVKYYIRSFGERLGKERGCDLSFQEAVSEWYDQVYAPVTNALRASGVLEKFPQRTLADLFVWTWKHEQLLGERAPNRFRGWWSRQTKSLRRFFTAGRQRII